jgi:uncharacterized protein
VPDGDAPESTWRAAVERERAAREARLRDPMGWLSLVGLHWLQPGRQRFGGSTRNEIVLKPADGDVAAVAGVIEVTGSRVLLHPEPGAALTVGGRPIVDVVELADDEADTPTMLELASLRLVLIRRAGRLGLRVRDTAAPALRAFQSLDYFAIDPRWRISARLLRGAPDATIPVPDVLGNVIEERTPGVVEFEVDGRPCRLHALEAGPDTLALLFGDRTNGHETYGGGRFLVTGTVRDDDSVDVDFNLAYDPPCVFSPYATCPMPPRGNRLDVRIEAGEKAWLPPDGGA